MERGRIINTIAWGLKPVIIKVNINKMVAMELREAKKPLVVEKRPTRDRANMGKLIKGERNTLSTVLCQEKTGAIPVAILLKKSPGWKPLAKSSSLMVSGWL